MWTKIYKVFEDSSLLECDAGSRHFEDSIFLRKVGNH